MRIRIQPLMVLLITTFIATPSFAQSGCSYPVSSTFAFYPDNIQSVPTDNSGLVISGSENARNKNLLAKGSYFILYFSPSNLNKVYSIGNCSSVGGIDDGTSQGSSITLFDYENGSTLAYQQNTGAGGVCLSYTPTKSGHVVVSFANSSCNSNAVASNKLLIKRTDTVIVPSNDEPNGATTLTPSACGSNISTIGTLKNSNHSNLSLYGVSEQYTNCTCEGNMPYSKGKDVWYKFNSGASNSFTISIASDASWPQSQPPNLVRVFYSPNGVNQFQLVNCMCSDNNAEFSNLKVSNLTTNSTYFLAVSTNSEPYGYNYSDFSIGLASGTCEPCSSPTITSTTINKGSSATLSATGCSGSVRWYDSIIGGSTLSIGNTFTTPNINNTGTYNYYAACVEPGCVSNNRSESKVTVNDCNDFKVSIATVPSGNNAKLIASNCNGNIRWYNSITGGTLIETGDTLITKKYFTAGKYPYFVECTNSGCVTTNRKTALVIVDNNLPTVNSPTIEKGNAATLTVGNCIGSFILWRKGSVDVQNGGTTYVTEIINTEGVYTYSVFCKTDECSSTNVRGISKVSVTGDCPNIANVTHPSDDYNNINEILYASSSGGKIQASNWVTGSSSVKYISPVVVLNPGFKVDLGAVFEAKNGGCNN